MKKRTISTIVTFSLFSNLAVCTASASNSVNYKFICNDHKTLRKNETKVENKNEGGIIKKAFLTLAYYGGIVYSAVTALSNIGYIDNSKFSENYGKVKDFTIGIANSGKNYKKILKTTLKNKKVLRPVAGNFIYRAGPMYTAGKVLGKIGSYALGVPDVGGLVGLGVAAYTSLTSTGKSFYETAIEPVEEKLADYIPDDE